jgi:hypothetical protein
VDDNPLITKTDSEPTQPTSGLGGLILYYEEFVPRYLPACGRRWAQMLAKRHNFPLVRLGRAVYIDPELAADRLRAAQLGGREPRRPGRPPGRANGGA